MSRVSFKFKMKRAAFIAALFFSNQIFASGKTETYKDIIEKAYNLSLQQERQQALSLLVVAIKRESKKNSPPKEILDAIDEVANIFYSDNTQQIYELALSLKQTDPNAALAKVREALKIESDNQVLLIEEQRLLLITGDCDASINRGIKVLEQNPFSEISKLHISQAAVCNGKFKLVSEYHPSFENDKKNISKGLSAFWVEVEVDQLFKQSKFDEAMELVTLLEKAKFGNPEILFLKWRIEAEMGQKNEKSGQAYVAACHKLTLRQSRELDIDPMMCRHVGEVENSLKKSHNP